jgi:hypothetical protein
MDVVLDSGRSAGRFKFGNRFFNPLLDDSSILNPSVGEKISYAAVERL